MKRFNLSSSTPAAMKRRAALAALAGPGQTLGLRPAQDRRPPTPVDSEAITVPRLERARTLPAKLPAVLHAPSAAPGSGRTKRSIPVTYRNVLAGLALATLMGCGTMPGERAVSGAAIGAGAGAVLGTVTGMGPGTGAAIGAASGAAVGGLTNKRQVNLGRPFWER